MITEVNESKTIKKHVSWEYKRKDIGKKRNSNQKCNKDK